jgi:transmembrane sensor
MTMNDEDRNDRSATAIDWWVRLDAGALSHAELSAFQAWLAKDPANEAAFEEICAFWGDLDRLRGRLPIPSAAPARPSWFLPAAAVSAAAIVLFFSFNETLILWRSDYSTGNGEVKIVTLEDGSRVQLNADTAIAKDFSGGQRRLILLKGEAWFEVASDPSRPFTVAAAGGTTTALGTSFEIATEPARTDVTVTGHRVFVDDGGARQSVAEGQQTAYGPGLPVLTPYSVDTDGITAWRRGKLIFQDKPLGEVIAALNRYHRGFFWAAPSIRDRRVTGVFSTAKPAEAIRAIELSLGLNATHLGDYLVLLRG